MKILFINYVADYADVNKPIEWHLCTHLGISYISSILKKQNNETKLLIVTPQSSDEYIINKVQSYNPGAILYTAFSSNFNHVSQVAKLVADNFPSIYQVLGGVHITINPHRLETLSVNAICIGEGEYPMAELFEQLNKGQKPTGIKNLWFKNNGIIEKNSTREFNQNLDDLPFPDREIWQDWIDRKDPMHTIIPSRGCTFNCTYCCNHKIKKAAPGKYVRFRSVENVIAELKELIEFDPTLKMIYFEAETIGLNLKFGYELCDALEKFNKENSISISYGINLRISTGQSYGELFTRLKKANFSFINIGLESGSREIREKVLKRFYTNEDIIRNVHFAKELGLAVHLYVMVGLPGETYEDFMKTVDCLDKCEPTHPLLSIFYPYEGTELYNLCEREGYLAKFSPNLFERKHAVLDLPTFPREKVQAAYQEYLYKFYSKK
jgi:anaerobic magnesium-protoporphyrin IX monomethyl ester cyclase